MSLTSIIKTLNTTHTYQLLAYHKTKEEYVTLIKQSVFIFFLYLDGWNLVTWHYSWHNTCILDGLLTSKDAEALKDKVETGLDNVTEFSIVRLLVSIDWPIFSTFTNGILPAASRGKSSEEAVYLMQGMKNQRRSYIFKYL